MRVRITDVFLRDGLQDESVVVPTSDKVAIAAGLIDCGVDRLEVASFVNPAKVPQMADAEELLGTLPDVPHVTYTSLTLNGRGISRASKAGAADVQIVASASQAHSNANAGRSVTDALTSLAAEVDKHPHLTFFAGISTAFTCPFEGEIEPGRVIQLVRRFKDMGVKEIGLADTLGTTPTRRLMASVNAVIEAEPDLDYSLHLHNAHGQAFDTVTAAVGVGISRFDSALAGFGGCPFAPGAHGNIATEELVTHLHGLGHETGIDEDRIHALAHQARALVRNAPKIASASHR